MDLQPEKYGLSFDIKKCTTSGRALGDENVIGIRAFNLCKVEVNVWLCEAVLVDYTDSLLGAADHAKCEWSNAVMHIIINTETL